MLISNLQTEEMIINVWEPLKQSDIAISPIDGLKLRFLNPWDGLFSL